MIRVGFGRGVKRQVRDVTVFYAGEEFSYWRGCVDFTRGAWKTRFRGWRNGQEIKALRRGTGWYRMC
jgi:hypothetical protein